MQCSLPSPPSKEGGSQTEIVVITVHKTRNNHGNHGELDPVLPLGFKGELEGDPALESMIFSKIIEPINAENTDNTITSTHAMLPPQPSL